MKYRILLINGPVGPLVNWAAPLPILGLGLRKGPHSGLEIHRSMSGLGRLSSFLWACAHRIAAHRSDSPPLKRTRRAKPAGLGCRDQGRPDVKSTSTRFWTIHVPTSLSFFLFFFQFTNAENKSKRDRKSTDPTGAGNFTGKNLLVSDRE